jgi:hypothetical protein
VIGRLFGCAADRFLSLWPSSVVRDADLLAAAAPPCGSDHLGASVHYVCTKPSGHRGDHGCAGVFWPDDDESADGYYDGVPDGYYVRDTPDGEFLEPVGVCATCFHTRESHCIDGPDGANYSIGCAATLCACGGFDTFPDTSARPDMARVDGAAPPHTVTTTSPPAGDGVGHPDPYPYGRPTSVLLTEAARHLGLLKAAYGPVNPGGWGGWHTEVCALIRELRERAQEFAEIEGD